jgi:O-antigen/teichoic acid export membrane protein
MAGAAFKYKSIDTVLWAHIGVVGTKVAVSLTWGVLEGFQRPAVDREVLRKVLRYAFPVSLSGLFFVATGYSDQIFLSKYLAPAEFAIYSFGCLAIPPLTIFETSVNRVAVPRMSSAFHKGRSPVAMHLFRDSISELSWLLLPATVGLIIFARPIVVLLFTEKFIAAAFFLKIYALNHVISSLPYNAVDRARARGDAILKRLALFSGVSVLCVYGALRMYGATGALIASVSAAFLMRATAIYNVHRSEAWPLNQMLPWRDWLRYAFFAAAGSIGALLLEVPLGGGLRWFLGAGAVFSAIYLAGTVPVFLRRRRELQQFST